jgi:hypothetical protein
MQFFAIKKIDLCVRDFIAPVVAASLWISLGHKDKANDGSNLTKRESFYILYL